MQADFLFKFIVVTIITTFQTYTMENIPTQQIIQGNIQSTLCANQSNHQAISKDGQKKSALFKTPDHNLIKSAITHTKQACKLQLNDTTSEAVYIKIDLLEKEQKPVSELQLDSIEKATIKNDSTNCNCCFCCCNSGISSQAATTCDFMIFPGTCFCALACFIVIFPILAIAGVLPHVS